MKIIVEGHLIDTLDIWDIVYSSDSREVTVTVRLIDKSDIIIGRKIPYETRSTYEYAAPYKRLYESVRDKWQSDKTNIDIFKLYPPPHSHKPTY